jgi:hypothetical protein
LVDVYDRSRMDLSIEVYQDSARSSFLFFRAEQFVHSTAALIRMSDLSMTSLISFSVRTYPVLVYLDQVYSEQARIVPEFLPAFYFSFCSGYTPQ